MTDAPPKGVTKVLVTASKIEAQRSGAEGESGWTIIVESPPVFDLVAVTGFEDVLGSNALPEASYGQVRLSVTKVVVTIEGKDTEATIPSDKLRVVGGFEVAANKTTVLTLDFDADKSVVLAGPRVQFKPVVKLLTQAPADKPQPVKRATVAIPLKELGGSGQTGVATLTAKGGKTEVVLQATAGVSRANHIHTGSCGPSLGGVKYPLTNMDTGKSTTTVDVPLDDLLTGGFAINLHKSDNAAVYTSCGDIPAKDKFMVVTLKELGSSGQTGSSTLISQADKTDVVLVATAGVSRANHIHSGSCGPNLGGVVHPLTNMADGISATSVNVSLESLRTGGFAINLHKADNAAVYTSCGDIPAVSVTAALGADLVIPLKELGSSGQTGVALLTAKGNQTEVILQATAGVSRANHIHTGTCDKLGGVVHPLTNMANGVSVTTVNVKLDSLLTGGFAINLHKADNTAIYTSCGDIPAKGKFVTISLEELQASGQKGVASLIVQADKTDVVLVATADVSEANHIHTGTCDKLGGVVHPLTNMAGGRSMTTVNVKLESLQTGGFAVNLHKKGAASVYTSCGDIPVTSGGTTSTSTTSPLVSADILQFKLPTLAVLAGTTVTWTNHDGVSHTVSSGKDGVFDITGWDSGSLDHGQTFSHSFNQAGTFDYTCRVHSNLNATVTVTASGTGSMSSNEGYVY